jgi:hypothetical protein
MQWFTKKCGLIEVSFAVVLIVLMSLLFLALPKPEGRVYDCSVAEISPDFTPEMRKECRERRSHKL